MCKNGRHEGNDPCELGGTVSNYFARPDYDKSETHCRD
jgi:hypothetical protein